MSQAAVLFVKPGAIRPSYKGELRKAGIIVVEIEDPANARFVRPGMELSHGDILAAAATAIRDASYDDVRVKFGAAMTAAILAAHPASKP